MSNAMWYVEVETDDGVVAAPFYRYDAGTNPLEDDPERFGHSLEHVPEQYRPEGGYGSDDIREVVDGLDEDVEYWILDSHDELGEYFPSVPDVPGYSNPTMFVAVPRDAVVNVTTAPNTG